ncbi:dephospho-CoA kinase [Streptococcus pacificus]|uniref:Dephospho-CoA kinase n=1 Tax=Streptococcus pacificus TaxID=2740577 RepID=A0ABS0ZI69_9STRE|nr:dephospho-CoA kinase [Streptococcus pacificus]MBJ8325699.1 dephospho-CoA kinase [Streptococcus pacificus]
MKTTIIGLTGGIASGKSLVSQMIKEEGFVVIDADEVVHNLQKKGGKLYRALVAFFGDEILQSDGELDRPKLSALFFSNRDVQKKMSQLQDDIIREALAMERKRASQKNALFFMDIPLLFERHYEASVDEVWLVYVDEQTQLKRLMARNNYTKEEALERINAQESLEIKKKKADVIIDNNGSKEVTKQKVLALLKQVSS